MEPNPETLVCRWCGEPIYDGAILAYGEPLHPGCAADCYEQMDKDQREFEQDLKEGTL